MDDWTLYSLCVLFAPVVILLVWLLPHILGFIAELIMLVIRRIKGEKDYENDDYPDYHL